MLLVAGALTLLLASGSGLTVKLLLFREAAFETEDPAVVRRAITSARHAHGRHGWHWLTSCGMQNTRTRVHAPLKSPQEQDAALTLGNHSQEVVVMHSMLRPDALQAAEVCKHMSTPWQFCNEEQRMLRKSDRCSVGRGLASSRGQAGGAGVSGQETGDGATGVMLAGLWSKLVLSELLCSWIHIRLDRGGSEGGVFTCLTISGCKARIRCCQAVPGTELQGHPAAPGRRRRRPSGPGLKEDTTERSHAFSSVFTMHV